MKTLFVGLAVAVLLAGVGCAAITNPDQIPDGASLVTPPASFETYWQQTEACSGITADFHRVTWFEAPSLEADGVKAYGLTNEHAHFISLTRQGVSMALAGDTTVAGIVRHEMLHDLTQQRGHPPEFFVEKCGAVVAH